MARAAVDNSNHVRPDMGQSCRSLAKWVGVGLGLGVEVGVGVACKPDHSSSRLFCGNLNTHVQVKLWYAL